MQSLYQEALNVAAKPIFIKKNFLAEKAFSFKYIRYRLLRPLLKLYTKSFRLTVKNAPWLTPPATTFLNRVLDRQETFLEFGSGRSTLFFASRVKELISVEHHEGWFKKISTLLEVEGMENVKYVLHPPAEEDTKADIDQRHLKEFDKELIKYGINH